MDCENPLYRRKPRPGEGKGLEGLSTFLFPLPGLRVASLVLTNQKKEPGVHKQHDTGCDKGPFAGTVSAWGRDLGEPGGLVRGLVPC